MRPSVELMDHLFSGADVTIVDADNVDLIGNRHIKIGGIVVMWWSDVKSDAINLGRVKQYEVQEGLLMVKTEFDTLLMEVKGWTL